MPLTFSTVRGMNIILYYFLRSPKYVKRNRADLLRSTLINLTENYNATEFYVESNGNFDAMVRRQFEDLSHTYLINYSVVLAYLPVKKNKYDNFTNTIFSDGIGTVPKRFAISWRNKWMIQQSDIVVTYVTHNFGGAWRFKELADRMG